MGTAGRRRAIERLTRAVYDGEARRHAGDERREGPRWLPGPWSALALVLAAALVALASALHASGAGEQATPAGPPSAGAVPSASASSARPGEERGARTASPSARPGSVPVIVYVTGRVRAPGVVELAAGERVQRAIQKAGGPLPDADLAALNLARVAADGEHIVVWKRGQAPASPAGAPSSGQTGDARAGGALACVDLNTADQTQLETLDGVGPALAERIVEYRERSGPLTSVEQLDEVSGIGPAILARIETGVCR